MAWPPLRRPAISVLRTASITRSCPNAHPFHGLITPLQRRASKGQNHEELRHPRWLRRQHPEVRETKSNATVTTVSLATSRSFKDSEGNRRSETEWHRITCFNGIGKSIAEHVTKGAMIMVTGRIHYTKWVYANGTDRCGCEIIAEQVDFLAKLGDDC